MESFEVEGILQELLYEVELWEWTDLERSRTRSEAEIAHDLMHAFDRYGYTIVRKNDTPPLT